MEGALGHYVIVVTANSVVTYQCMHEEDDQRRTNKDEYIPK